MHIFFAAATFLRPFNSAARQGTSERNGERKREREKKKKEGVGT
jgi:hypothetical protein